MHFPRFVQQAYAQTSTSSADIFGKIPEPQGVAEYNAEAGGIGIILFANRIILLITVIAGIWTLFNIIMAGVTLISAGGKPDAYSKAIQRVLMSVVGIVVIVASYTIAGLIGMIFFGDATFILNPQLQGPS